MYVYVYVYVYVWGWRGNDGLLVLLLYAVGSECTKMDCGLFRSTLPGRRWQPVDWTGK